MNARQKQIRARRRLVHENPFALRLAAFAVIFRYFYTVGVMVFTVLALAIFPDERRTALALLIALPIVWIWAALSTSGLRCLVCPNPVLKARGSVKHRSARSILGSYTLGMATQLIFAKRFRCMHCGTQQRLVDVD